MRIVIVEDEALVARRLERLTREVLGTKISSLRVESTLREASNHLFERPVDLLLLDLNLNGKDGFDLLRKAVSGSFHTIVVSANLDRAVEAFEYGVLDFVAKPFTVERLSKAFTRFEKVDGKEAYPTKYMAVRKNEKLELLRISDVKYIKGAGIYSEIHLKDGSFELHDKTLAKLADILPADFLRIHKSYIVNLQEVKHFRGHGASKYDLVLHSEEALPVSRTKYREIKRLIT